MSIDFEDALVQSAKGRILPRQTAANEDTRFSYTVWPVGDSDDSGFNRVRISAPNAIDEDRLEVIVGEEAVAPMQIGRDGEHLVIDLPALIRADSVAISFTTRVLRNATVFGVDLGHSERPGLWQSVEERERRDNIVFLPGLAAADRLIGDLAISPRSFTPHGDGINDALEVRFALFKVTEATPRVKIYDLSGREVAELDRAAGGELEIFRWRGLDREGTMVPPGIYLCHIDALAESGADEVIQTISVVY